MLQFHSDINGRTATYGEIKEIFEREGLTLGGNWSYEGGYFDQVLSSNEGETYYLRIPVEVIEGALDEHDALIRFGEPIIVKHIVHIGLENDQYQTLGMDQAGLSPLWNQFQTPINTDGEIRDERKWIELSKERINRLLRYL